MKVKMKYEGRENVMKLTEKMRFRYVSLDLEGYRTGSSNPEKKDV
jgi:PP-loop superfamily ATP-utilizing enzyme